MFGMHWELLPLVAVAIIPILIGVFWMLPDANRHG